MHGAGNILSHIPAAIPEEICEILAESGGIRIERIISLGQTTPEGVWYDQERDEWVLVLSGCAELLFEGEQRPRPMAAGDYVMIPARCRHRVTRTDPAVATVWLAIHFGPHTTDE